MDEKSKIIVDISLERMVRGDVKREIRNEKIKSILFVAIVVGLITSGIYFYESDAKAPMLDVQAPVTNVGDNGEISVTIKQDRYGHYTFVGEINGKKVKFLLDTGATYVAVPVSIAKYLGLPFGKTYYSQTANGKSLSYRSSARNVKVGGIVLFDVDSSIATGMDGDEILLGMSFLKYLGMVQENGEVIITQKVLPVNPIKMTAF